LLKEVGIMERWRKWIMYWTGTMSSVSEEKIVRSTVRVAVKVKYLFGGLAIIIIR
jgi:hypothetical protein